LGTLTSLKFTKTCGVAVVIGDDDGGIERLKVQNEHRIGVVVGVRFHDKRKTFRSILLHHILTRRAK
jgi:hypothetical protein